MPVRRLRVAFPAAALALALIPAAPAAAARQSECGTRGHQTSAQDETWLMTAMQGDRFEILGGTAAQSKGATAAMKARRPAREGSHEVAARRRARRASLRRHRAQEPSPSEQWELRMVGLFSGTPFDRSYAFLEVQDHIQDIQETKDEISDGCSRTVRSLARDDLPVLGQHLQIARQLAASGI